MIKRYLVLMTMAAFTMLISGAATSAREVVVRRGESLSIIAARELGSMERWQELARVNGITDPRRLKEGQSLLIPSDDGSASVTASSALPASPSAAHLEGVPSIRRMSGAIRYRPNEAVQWVDLAAASELVRGAQVMTANNGTAELKADGFLADLGMFSILKVAELGENIDLKMMLGSLAARVDDANLTLSAGGNRIEGAACEFRSALDEAGTLRLTVIAGQVKLAVPSGQVVTVAAGYQALVRKGAAPELKELVSPVKLISPSDGYSTTEENILFQWSPVQGARGYRFEMLPADEAMPRLTDEVIEPKIQVNKVPEGRFTWSVTPLGIADAVRSKRISLVVDRSAPILRMNAPEEIDGEWVISGVSSPNAAISAGDEAVTASSNGAFTVKRRIVPGILILGVEARTRAGGTPTRAAVALGGRPDGLRVPVYAEIPGGRAFLNDQPASDFTELSEGTNNLSWRWDVGADKIAGGSLKLFVDMTPPEIHSVRTTPSRIFSGDKLTLYVLAKDKGTGLADPSTAKMTIAGPGDFTTELVAESISGDGEYVFVLNTPRNLRTGYLRVTKLDVSDRDGNAVILSSEGMATETVDPRSRVHKFMSSALLLGLGILIGAL